MVNKGIFDKLHMCVYSLLDNNVANGYPSRKHLRIKVTPDFHLTYSKNGGNLGSESK